VTERFARAVATRFGWPPTNATPELIHIYATLTISDEGPGIPQPDRAHVFDMFFRVRAGDGQPGGTGLGLAIAKGIIDAHGGSIRAEAATKESAGTRIVVTLPAAEPQDVPE